MKAIRWTPVIRSVLPVVLLAACIGCGSGDSSSPAGDAAAPTATDEEPVVNVYSARHYDSDDAVFERFTAETGIEVQRLEDRADVLLERIKSEGAAGPADLFIAVDAGRLFQAEQAGVLEPLADAALVDRVPAHLRHPDGLWLGMTKRARVIAYSRERVDPASIQRYEDLAKPEWKGRVLVRSSSSVYNQSLVGAIIDANGEAAAEEWCSGLVANMARPPQGGDRDQIRAIAAGEGDVAIVNSYYYAMMARGSDEDRAVVEKVGLLFPNQDDRGAHVNISGIGMVRDAEHPGNAARLMAFLLSDEAQELLSSGSNEFPTVVGVPLSDTLAAMGSFKEDEVNASVYGNMNPLAIQMMDRAGWR